MAHLSAAYGPRLACATCHDVPYAGLFLDNQDLDHTTVCNTCHSPGGIYDGVDSDAVSGSVGARDNWDAVMYSGGELAAGGQ